MIQQRPIQSIQELKDSIALALIENVPGDREGPDSTALMKANVAASKIGQLIDQFMSQRGIR